LKLNLKPRGNCGERAIVDIVRPICGQRTKGGERDWNDDKVPLVKNDMGVLFWGIAIAISSVSRITDMGDPHSRFMGNAYGGSARGLELL
jgi:hypothetical protein